MLQLETLHMMPPLSRVESEIEGEGGYEYPEKYQNHVYLYNDKVILFEKRKYHEYPIALIAALTEAISQNFITENNLISLRDALLEDFDLRITEVTQELEKIEYATSNASEHKIKEIRNGLISLEKTSHERLDELSEVISNLTDTVNSVNVNTSSIDKLIKDSKTYTEEMVGKELDTLYKNFQTGISNLVKEEVDKIKNLILSSENKIKPVQFMMYKEMGLDTDEIIKLKKENML